MAETRIELSGWHAVAALVVILGVSGIRVSMRFQSVPEEGREAVRQYLVKDYEGLGPAALAKRVAAYKAGLGDLPTQPTVEPVVEVSHLAAHGWRDSMIVRSEVNVDGGPPPDGRSVRYLFLTTKVGGGWMILGESDSYRYYTALVR
jgi:hypothetical protein